MDNPHRADTKVIGISGPDGAGKGYLTENALTLLNESGVNIREVQMLSTRNPRTGENLFTNVDDLLNNRTGMAGGKKCVTDQVFDDLQAQERLVGAHRNDNGFRYAYLLDDFLGLSGDAIIELNPVFQASVKHDLGRKGIALARWIGLDAEVAYLSQNIRERQPDISEEELAKKIGMAESIMRKLHQLQEQGAVELFSVGWHNRETMAQEFSGLIRTVLQTRQIK